MFSRQIAGVDDDILLRVDVRPRLRIDSAMRRKSAGARSCDVIHWARWNPRDVPSARTTLYGPSGVTGRPERSLPAAS